MPQTAASSNGPGGCTHPRPGQRVGGLDGLLQPLPPWATTLLSICTHPRPAPAPLSP